MIFVDTNVLLYAIDNSEPDKRDMARNWLDVLWSASTGLTSTQVLNEYYVNATQKVRFGLTMEAARKTVKSLYNWNPRAIDCELIDHAHEIQTRYRLSWWDSLIAAAAIGQRATMLLSEDLHDGLDLDGTVVRSPFKFSPDDLPQAPASKLNQPRARYTRQRKVT